MGCAYAFVAAVLSFWVDLTAAQCTGAADLVTGATDKGDCEDDLADESSCTQKMEFECEKNGCREIWGFCTPSTCESTTLTKGTCTGENTIPVCETALVGAPRLSSSGI